MTDSLASISGHRFSSERSTPVQILMTAALFSDCSNNNFKNESNGKEDTSAHATDGGDSGIIIFAGGEAKSESATINKH